MKQLNRKTLILLSVAAGVIGIAAVLLTLSLTVWAQPTKKDFEAAKATGIEISKNSGSDASREFTSKISAASDEGKSQQALIDSAAAEKKKAVDVLNTRIKLAEELGDSKVTRDEEVKKLYDTYLASEQRYNSYFMNYLNSYPVYQSSFTTCIDVFQFTKNVTNPNEYAAGQREASKDCFEDLNALEKSKIAPYAKYAKDFKSIINDRQKVFDDIEAKTINADSATSKKISDIAARYATISPAKALAEAREAASFKGELNNLIDLLGKRVTSSN